MHKMCSSCVLCVKQFNGCKFVLQVKLEYFKGEGLGLVVRSVPYSMISKTYTQAPNYKSRKKAVDYYQAKINQPSNLQLCVAMRDGRRQFANQSLFLALSFGVLRRRLNNHSRVLSAVE